MKKRSAIVLLLCSVMALSAVGCGEPTIRKKASEVEQAAVPAEEPAETPTPVPTPVPEDLKNIGVPAEGGYTVRAVNRTGRNIKSVAIREQNVSEFGGNMLSGEDIYMADEARMLCFKPEGGGEAERRYDVQMIFEDGTSHVLHDFPFGRVDDCEIFYEDDVLFLTYVDEVTGAPVSTRALEIAAADAEAQQDVQPEPEEEPEEEPAAPTSAPAQPTPTRIPARPTTAPWRPTTAPWRPTTAPVQPTTPPAEPTTPPSEPTTPPGEPTTPPSEPTTPPSEPTTPPSEPTTPPSEPTTPPSEPTIPPSEPTTAPPSVPTTAPVDPGIGDDTGLGDDTVITY